MALLADTKTQNAVETGASALSLLSSLKAGLKGAKSGGFAELMSAFESMVSQKRNPDLPVREDESRVKAAGEKSVSSSAVADSQQAVAPAEAAPERPVRKKEALDKGEKEESKVVSEKEEAETVAEEPVETERADVDFVPEEKPEILADKPEGQAAVPAAPGQDEESMMALWLVCQTPIKDPKPTGCSSVDQGEEAELEGDLDADTTPVEGEEDGAWAALLGFTQEAREIKADAFDGALRVSSGVPASDDAAQAKAAKATETSELLQNGAFSAMTAKPEAVSEQMKGKTPLEALGGAQTAQTIPSDKADGADAEATKTGLQALFSRRTAAPETQPQTDSGQTQNRPQSVVQATVQTSVLLSDAPAVQTGTSSGSSNAVTGIGAGARAGGSYHFTAQLAAASAKESARPSAPALEQVTVQLRKMVKEGADEMTIRLRPEELGRIDIKLEFTEDKKVHGTITADKAATLQLLQKDADALQKVLQDAGLQADAGCLDFSLRGDGQDGSSARRDASAGSRPDRFDGGDSFEGESIVATDEIEQYYITPERVNLRV